MYCLHNHLFLKFFLFRIFRVVLLFSYQCSFCFQSLIFISFVRCADDLFCLRQRDIYYHTHFNLSSTFFNFFNSLCQLISCDNIHYVITTFITCQHSFSHLLTLTSQPFNKSFICCSTSMPQTEKEGFEPSRRSRDLHP